MHSRQLHGDVRAAKILPHCCFGGRGQFLQVRRSSIEHLKREQVLFVRNRSRKFFGTVYWCCVDAIGLQHVPTRLPRPKATGSAAEDGETIFHVRVLPQVQVLKNTIHATQAALRSHFGLAARGAFNCSPLVRIELFLLESVTIKYNKKQTEAQTSNESQNAIMPI